MPKKPQSQFEAFLVAYLVFITTSVGRQTPSQAFAKIQAIPPPRPPQSLAQAP